MTVRVSAAGLDAPLEFDEPTTVNAGVER